MFPFNLPKSWHMPDGTKTSNKPKDGQIWHKYDGNTGQTLETWQWDDFKEQWFNISSGTPNQYNTKTFVIPNSFNPIELDNWDCGEEDLSGYVNQDRSPTCECGSEKCGFPGHSSWCPKYAS